MLENKESVVSIYAFPKAFKSSSYYANSPRCLTPRKELTCKRIVNLRQESKTAEGSDKKIDSSKFCSVTWKQVSSIESTASVFFLDGNVSDR